MWAPQKVGQRQKRFAGRTQTREERVRQTVRDNLHAHSQYAVISPDQGQNRFSEAYSTLDADQVATPLIILQQSSPPISNS